MQIQGISEAYYAEPFKSFVIRLLDGRGFFVAQPYNIAIAPSGQELAYVKPDDVFALIDLAEIDRLERPRPKRRQRSAKVNNMEIATAETFGTQVYHELRRLSGFDTLTATLHYDAIQRLKKADRETTLQLFATAGIPLNSDSELNPATVARCVFDEAHRRTNELVVGLTVIDVVTQILSGLAAIA